MAARLRPQHQDEVRAKIQASQLVTRLQKIASGAVKGNGTQVTAALGLLKKVLPDLTAATLSTDPNNPFQVENTVNVSDLNADQLRALASIKVPTG